MRRIAGVALKVAVTSALLYFALRGFEFASFKAKLLRLEPVWVLAALLACAGQLFFGAIRWKSIIESCGENIRLLAAFRLLLVGTFFSQTLPSTVGGDGVRLLLLQRTGLSWRVATYSVFIDRATGLIVLAMMVMLSLPATFRLIIGTNARAAIVLTALVALSGGLAFLLLGLIPRKLTERWFALRHMQALAATTLVLLSHFRSCAKVVLASLAGHALSAAIAWSIANAVAIHLSFFQMFLLILPVTLISAIPVSIAGWGLREQALQFAFLSAGFDGNDGVLISLLFGLVYLAVGIIGGLVWLLGRERSVGGAEATYP